jgi:alkylation response protein AidB-like acyl-CoA dehydrogenase
VHGRGTGVLDEAWRYVQEREAFGKPIGEFQGVTFPLAEAETCTRPAAPCVCAPYG